MADYNLNGLNPRDFQHLVQAFARKQIAAGVTAFGDGKDGNRDLIYRGKMDYPSTQAAWDGYLVLGCKFNQRPTADTGKDTEWAVKQLTADLEKFLDSKRKLSKPEYYIFATNLALTGVADIGGRDRVTKTLEEYTPKLGLKGSAVWDYNDLRGFLDGDKDIRTAYGHFITVGDVLAQMMETLKPQRTDFADVMYTFLQKELLADMSAKLQAAGEDPEVQIPLANVFVDLPVADSAEAAALAQSSRDPEQPKIIERLLDVGACILRRPLLEQGAQPVDEPIALVSRTSRFVLVGGPGQGKSTLAQYLCQLYRAAILNDRPHHLLDERVPGVIRQLEGQREDVGGLPMIRRFAVRVELRTFSYALAQDSSLTLLEYLRAEIARLGSAPIPIEDLKDWLGSYPWLLVLDGLDEVPPSSNRADVMQQIEHFQIDATSRNADILIVATTRPQSYSQEFPSDLFQHLYLTPLSPKQALDYGRRLAQARCGADERRCEELMRNLEKACEAETTARLMQSPLQVTIMATLLEETGEPPQQRYRLFAEYYRTIYKRETRRRMLSGILSERQTDIDTIHAEAGLLLHAAGERGVKRDNRGKAGDRESSFSDDQFRMLVQRRLARIKVPEPTASDLVRRMTDSSLQRLVFLVRPIEGWIRFDLTSLKEFMAAEALMTGPDEDIRERLKTAAPAAYWRNVLLFAVGKCFIEKEYLLDNIVSICESLNDEKVAGKLLGGKIPGAASKATLWGSRLALDILAEGTARQNPEYESRLTKTALDLIRLSEPETAARLAAVYHNDLIAVFQEIIEDRLGQSDFWRQRGAWLLLMSLADRDIDWAKKMLERLWPSERRKQQILLLRGNNSVQPWFVRKLIDVLPHCDPASFVGPFRRYNFPDDEPDDYPDWWRPAMDVIMVSYRSGPLFWEVGQVEIPNRSKHFSSLAMFKLISIRKEYRNPLEHLQTLPLHHPGWAPFISAARFYSNPTTEVLRDELQWLAQTWEPDKWRWYRPIPFLWPLAACLETVKTKDDLQLLAERVAVGRLGTPEIWAAAEMRWSQQGIVDDDFRIMTDDRWPFDERIAENGFPFVACNWSLRRNRYEQLPRLLDQFRETPLSQIKTWMARTILRILRPLPDQNKVFLDISLTDLQELYTALSGDRRQAFNLDLLSQLKMPILLGPEWIAFFDWLGRQQISIESYRTGRSCPYTEQLVHSFCSAPEERRGLLPLLAELAVAGYKCEVPREVLHLCYNWDEHTKDDTTLLSLARGDLTSDEAIELAKKIAESKSLHTVWRALVLLRGKFPMERVASFALALLKQLPPSSEDGSEAFNELMSSLIAYLNRRPSLLVKSKVWHRLQLPEQILT